MDVFDLRHRLVADYANYIRSFISINDARIREIVDASFDAGLLWPDPLIQLNPTFEAGETVDQLVDQQVLHPKCREVFRLKKEDGTSQPLRLHRHQADAAKVARTGANYVLTTGTGSGKSLAYIIPIVDYVLRNGSGKGIRAIVVYPMNALANSQHRELEKFLCLGFPDRKGPVTFQRYTGQEKPDEKARIIAQPPDILLTNFVMLELILTRQDEVPLIRAAKGLRFLVFDELHTYRGRQGADVALLSRRVREALEASSLQYVGTSATLAGAGTYDEQRGEVARVASRIFGALVKPEHVIGETLRRATVEGDLASAAFRDQLRHRLEGFSPPSDLASLKADALAIWIESTFGLTAEAGTGRLVRARPRSITGDAGAAKELSLLTGVPETACVKAIQQTLLAGYNIHNTETGFPVFAFKLHQFISRGDTAYASLEAEGTRHITVQGQQFVPGKRDHILLPLAFCRECGQEYYVVWRGKSADGGVAFEGRDLSDRMSGDDAEAGFLVASTGTPWPDDDEAVLDRLPDDWIEDNNGKLRVRANRRKDLPEAVVVATDGREAAEGLHCHYVRTPFKFCLNCGVTYGSRQVSDYAKLGNVGAGGRSTATTILTLSSVRSLRKDLGLRPEARKLLSFTDNRQDASLQAGHFNDFVQVTLLRAALCRAVQQTGAQGIQHEELTQRVFDALALPLPFYASDPNVRFKAKEDTDRALREVIGYRLFLDLERGWRITSPNLEQCGLLEIVYQSLDDLCAAEDVWASAHPVLRGVSPTTRAKVCRTLLDHMRRELTIKVTYLDAAHQDQMRQLASQRLREPWAFDEDEKLQFARVLFPRSSRRDDPGDHYFLSPRGLFGQYLKRPDTLEGHPQRLATDDVQRICIDLLEALRTAGLVELVHQAEGKGEVNGYQMVASGMLWKAGTGGQGHHDQLRVPQQSDQGVRTNEFFKALYQSELSDLHGMEAKEHTAQVPSDRRQEREALFREAKLPVLFCSPTMELGVDIAELNSVNMRNVPPTPANYAQRSGRAGRQGQPALVFTYCTTGSSHDQYFFRRAELMVAGKVTPPNIELANEDLIRSHVHGIWLAETAQSLGSSLKDILVMDGPEPTLDLRPIVRDALSRPTCRQRAVARAGQVLADVLPELTESDWFHDQWMDNVLLQVLKSFEDACERWRRLYRSARKQARLQGDVILDASRSAEDKKQAERLRREAEAQLGLLTDSRSAVHSDFYSYRYFASEGFLAGYNFPRLPISAFIPARRLKGQDEFLSRPRFLAISEFGPRSIIYHEGSKYVINRVIMPVHEDGLALTRVKICSVCGYRHEVDATGHPDLCERCRNPLDLPLHDLFRLQNVSTRRRERINSDEEERVRMGYELRTAIRFTEHGGKASFRMARVLHQGQEVLRLTYGQAANLWRINLGWKKRENPNLFGFVLDIERGYWAKNAQLEEGDPDDPTSPNTRRVVPFVEDWRNSLLVEPVASLTPPQMASLQAALKHALQAVYHLEEDELAAEPLPDGANRRLLLLYEASEGGAGALRRLVDDPAALGAVAAVALQLCHFDPKTGADLKRSAGMKEDCEAACYNCLMSYSNQPDHKLLDRKAIVDILGKLAACTVETSPSQLPRNEHLEQLRRQVGSQLEASWLDFLDQHGLRLPARAQVYVEACQTRPDFLYEGDDKVAIYVDGPPHDYAERQARDAQQAANMLVAGYVVVRFGHRDNWLEIARQYPNVFGTPRQ